jgi:hypothetical protein
MEADQRKRWAVRRRGRCTVGAGRVVVPVGFGQAYGGWTALPELTVRVLDEPAPKPNAPAAPTPSRPGSGAEEGEDGKHAAVLVG